MNEQTLRPCPFCGGEAKIGENIGFYMVTCRECDCMSHPSMRYNNAIAAWNRRVPAAPALVLTDFEVVALRTYIDAYPYDSTDFGGPRPDVATAYNVLRAALAAAGGDDGK